MQLYQERGKICSMSASAWQNPHRPAESRGGPQTTGNTGYLISTTSPPLTCDVPSRPAEIRWLSTAAMAAEQYDGYSPQVADDWPSNDMSQLQHGPISSPAIPDPASDDLAYKPNARGNSFNNPPPNGWLYPHKKGIGTGSNLEPFKAEIEARTQRGENCKAIAAALNAMGVQTSDRAVSRVRIRWGMRKRVSISL